MMLPHIEELIGPVIAHVFDCECVTAVYDAVGYRDVVSLVDIDAQTPVLGGPLALGVLRSARLNARFDRGEVRMPLRDRRAVVADGDRGALNADSAIQ
jgi:hypothetical protein